LRFSTSTVRLATWQGLEASLSVKSLLIGETDTNRRLQLNRFIAPLYNFKQRLLFLFPISVIVKNGGLKEWIIDSGASSHFTGNINNYVDYEVLENPAPVMTANSSAVVEGKGMVILVLSTGEAIRIYPVY